MAPTRRVLLPLTAMVVLSVATVWHADAAIAQTTAQGWSWPVSGPVIRGFEAPATPYGSGHRGIDIGAPQGTPVTAPAPGVVRFAGPIGGELFVSIDHGGGIVSTCSWLSSIAVARGDVVLEGALLGLTGIGHPGSLTPHLHFGVRVNGAYVDPMTLLAPASVVDLIRLAPLSLAGAL